jgi:hypothetical protein
MAQLNVEVPDELMKELRKEIMNRFDGKKGDLKKAVEEAIRLWIQTK